ncbi:MAG: NAD(P)/FAD-dependent oxidoreductase [Thermoplasmatota archaeon]
MAEDLQSDPDETSGSGGSDNVYDLIIIGGGPAGTSSAIYASRGKLRTLVIDKDIGQGAMGGDHPISNYPGFPGITEAGKLLGLMREQAEGLGAEFILDKVIYTDFRGDLKEVSTPARKLFGKSVILATGSMGREPSIGGESMFVGRGVAYCAICDAPYFEGKKVAVTGSADRILDELDMISRFAQRIFYISPSGKISDEDIERLRSIPNLITMPGFRLKSVKGSASFEGVLLKGPDGDEVLDVDGIFLYLQGNRPVADYIVDTLERGENGCLVVNEADMSTSIPGVYSAGDLRCKPFRQISLAVGDGCRAALSAERYVKGSDRTSSQWS